MCHDLLVNVTGFIEIMSTHSEDKKVENGLKDTHGQKHTTDQVDNLSVICL